MVELIPNSLEDTLIDGLPFKLAKTASYITNRMSVTCHPQGSNLYSPGILSEAYTHNDAGHDCVDP